MAMMPRHARFATQHVNLGRASFAIAVDGRTELVNASARTFHIQQAVMDVGVAQPWKRIALEDLALATTSHNRRSTTSVYYVR